MEYNELVFLDQSQHKYLDIVFSMYPASLLFSLSRFSSFPPPPALFAPDAQGIIGLVT